MDKPKDLIDGLSNNPLSYLFPFQQLAPQAAIIPLPAVSVPDIITGASPEMDRLKHALDSAPELARELAEDDFGSEEMKEILKMEVDSLRFKKPSIKLKEVPNPRLPFYEEYVLSSLNSQINLSKPPIKVKRGKLMYKPEDEHVMDDFDFTLQRMAPKRSLQENVSFEETEMGRTEKRPKISYDLAAFIELLESQGTSFNKFWIELAEDQSVLSDEALNRIDESLRNTPSGELSVDTLCKVESLMHKSLGTCIEKIQISDLTTRDESTILKTGIVLSGLKCCAIILTILNMAREEKVLYVDSHLKSIIELVYTVCDDFICPFYSLFDDSDIEAGCYACTILVSQLIPQLSQYVWRGHVDEMVVTRLEYLCMRVVFQDLSLARRNQQMAGAAELLQQVCVSLLCCIFEKFLDQREFVLEELMTNMEKLPVNRMAFKSFKIAVESNVVSVSLISIFLLDLLSTFTIEVGDCGFMREYQPDEELPSEMQNILQNCEQKWTDLTGCCNYLSSVLVNRILTGGTWKSHFELLLEDLLNLMYIPQYCVSETLLYSIMRTLMYICQEKGSAELLEMIGVIGSRIVDIENNCHLELYEKVLDEHKAPALFLKALHYLSAENSVTSRTVLKAIVLPSADSSQQTGQYSQLLGSWDLSHLREPFFQLITKFLDHPKVKTRSRAMKMLNAIVSKNSKLLRLPAIQNCISTHLVDSSSLVKDATLDMVSNYIELDPAIADELQTKLCQLLCDGSISIRKKAIKVMSGKMSLVSKETRIAMFVALLGKQNDEEDSVTDLAKASLLDLCWNQMPLNDAMVLMSKVVSVQHDLFSKFIKENVLHKGVGTKESARLKYVNSLRELVEKTVDTVVSCLNSSSDMLLALLSCLAQLDGSLISQNNLVSLEPYLMVTEHSCTLHLLRIFKLVLPSCRTLNRNLVNNLAMSILKKLTKFNAKELNEAVPCAWILLKELNQTSKMSNVCISVLKLMRPLLDNADSEVPKLQRLLYLLGNLGKHCQFEGDRELFIRSGVLASKDESVISNILKYLLTFANGSLDVRRIAIRNLVGVCVTNAKFFAAPPILEVLDREMGRSGEYEIKDVITQGFIEFLQEQERVTISKIGLDTKNSRKLEIDVDVFHGNSEGFVNDGICSMIVQRFLPQILDTCLLPEVSKCFLPISFLQLAVKYGFGNPKICIPTIVALEASSNATVRSMALEMHTKIYEKHESLVESSYNAGVKMAFEYRSCESWFFTHFFSVFKDDASCRRRIWKSFIRMFQGTYFKSEENAFFMRFAQFLTANIASLEFLVLEEVYIIVHGIDSALSFQSIQPIKPCETLTEWQNQAHQAFGYVCLSHLRAHLVTKYHINEEKAQKINLAKSDKELKISPRSKPVVFQMPNGNFQSIENCQRLCHLLNHISAP